MDDTKNKRVNKITSHNTIFTVNSVESTSAKLNAKELIKMLILNNINLNKVS